MKFKTVISLFISFVLLLSVILTSCSSSGSGGTSFSPPSNGVGRTDTPEPQETDQVEVKLPPNGKTVIIDPGHGFRDPGAGAENYELGEGRDERWVTLAVSKVLAEKLESLGYTVLFTHQGESNPEIERYLDDNYFDPTERVAVINSKSCDYSISLHCNIFDNPDVDGTKLFVWNPYENDPVSEQIAGLIGDEIDAAFPDARKCTIDTKESLALVRDVTVPSILIEMGFVSSPTDAAKLVDPEWHDKFSKAVADGINDYFFPTEKDSSGPTETESETQN